MNFDFAGIKIGHAADEKNYTGCTVFLCPEGAIASVDARGPAPGSRELTLLRPDKPNQTVNAIVLTGGSAFGLATADGVMDYLAERGVGHPTPIKPIPIVSAAVVYDLFFSQGKSTPDQKMGYAACLDARADNFAQGNVGAGAGVTVGKWGGFTGVMKGGFGLATIRVGDLVVSAATAVNAIGDVVNEDGSTLAGAMGTDGRWLADAHPHRFISRRLMPPSGTNTTLVVVMTNAKMNKNDAYLLAQRAHDGMAIAIRPAHTRHDGDTAYAIATRQIDAPYDLVANLAVDAVSEAIRSAVRQATTVEAIRGLKNER